MMLLPIADIGVEITPHEWPEDPNQPVMQLLLSSESGQLALHGTRTDIYRFALRILSDLPNEQAIMDEIGRWLAAGDLASTVDALLLRWPEINRPRLGKPPDEPT